jgi:glycosyltransferase involved in cell wall biosynthesis
VPGLVYAARNYLSQADMFVLSSRCEGFPNVLLEAMASGLPAVSFDCQSGPSDIIRHGQDGLLVEAGDVTALKKNMETLMLSSELRQRLGQNARAVQERFSLTRVMDMWNKLIDESGSLR